MASWGNDEVPSHSVVRNFYSGNMLGNALLRVGEVMRAIPPSDPQNRSKKYWEYDVYIRRYSNDTVNSGMYTNCLMSNPFGGIADKLVYTPRIDKNARSNKYLTGQGTKVLVLCVNGIKTDAVIVGGVRDVEDKKDKEDLGHHFQFTFNGIDCSVNNEGEFNLFYNGKTDIDGKRNKNVQESVTGTKVSFLKNGNLVLSTRDGDQSVTLDHENGKVLNVANKEWRLTVNNGKCIIKSQGVELGDATDSMLLGTTYRSAEQQLHQDIVSGLTGLATKVGTAAALLNTAGSAMSVPIIGPVTAGPQIINAAAQLLQAVQDIVKMTTAVSSFEGKANTYLSKKNKLD